MGDQNSNDPLRFVRKDLLTQTRYNGVESLESIATEIGMEVKDLIKLNANENVYGTAAAVTTALADAPHFIYPDPQQHDMREALAKFHGVSKDEIVAGAGSDDILDILIRLTAPKAIVISTPTFGMYSFLGKLCDAKIVDVERKADFTVDVDAVKAAIEENEATLVFLPSPNNPTGTILPHPDILELLKCNSLLVVDEAYADFCDPAFSALDLVKQHSNLIVTRTFSKWAGLAGLRLGYCIAHEALVNQMIGIKQPYNVNTAANAAGLTALKQYDEIKVTVDALKVETQRLFGELEKIEWLRPVPSKANFVLIEVLAGKSAKGIYEYLRKKGILIRFFGSQGGKLQNFIRISAGKPENTDSVIEALKVYSE